MTEKCLFKVATNCVRFLLIPVVTCHFVTGLSLLHVLVRMDAAMERDRLLALEKERAKEEAKKRLVANFGAPLGLYSCTPAVKDRHYSDWMRALWKTHLVILDK